MKTIIVGISVFLFSTSVFAAKKDVVKCTSLGKDGILCDDGAVYVGKEALQGALLTCSPAKGDKDGLICDDGKVYTPAKHGASEDLEGQSIEEDGDARDNNAEVTKTTK